jgi:hypothetical protein
MHTYPLPPLLKSWLKVFAAAAVAGYMAGGRDWQDLFNAGLVAVLPLVYTWLDPNDERWGRHK